MSWFPDDFTPADLRTLPADDHPRHPAPGVSMIRRNLFRIGGAAALALMLGPSALRAGQAANRTDTDSPFEPLSLEDFIDRADPLARAITDTLAARQTPNEEAYLLHLASLLCRLGPRPVGAERPRGMMYPHHRTPYFMVMQINMSPGAALPWHDHRDYNGVILGLEGSVRARNFEILGDNPIPPAGQSFEIRQTADTVVEPGRVSTLARNRDNIHDLRAGPGGARLLDVFTFFPGSAGSHYLAVDETPVEGRPDIYTARWRA